MDKVLISVIIPVYNSARFIARCIDSVINQTYDKLDILIINDGSTDQTLDIVNNYKGKDERIRIIDKENEGVSKTRNRGLKEALGKYIYFIDSDDFIDSDIIEKLYIAIKKDDTQLSVCRFVYTFDDYEKNAGVGIKEDAVLNREQYLFHMSQELYSVYYGALWNKLYDTSIIKQINLTFPTDISLAEDFMFNLRYLEGVNSISVINEFKYHYNQENDNSLTKRKDVDYLWNMARIRYNICIEQYKKMDMYDKCFYNIQNAIAYEIISPTYNIVKENYEGYSIAKKKLKKLYDDDFAVCAINNMISPQMVHRIAKISLKFRSYGLFVILMRIWIKIQRYEGQ